MGLGCTMTRDALYVKRISLRIRSLHDSRLDVPMALSFFEGHTAHLIRQ